MPRLTSGFLAFLGIYRVGVSHCNVGLQRIWLSSALTPEHGTHYVGLRFDQLGECLHFLNGDKDRLSEIAARGRRWALTHYAPAPTALRFLHTVERMITSE